MSCQGLRGCGCAMRFEGSGLRLDDVHSNPLGQVVRA